MTVFITGLVISGVTAFPLLLKLRILDSLLDSRVFWISHVHQGLEATYTHYPWIAYGTDRCPLPS